MYKLTRETKNGMNTSISTHLHFNDAFDSFIELMNIHEICRFNSFGIPLDSDIKHIGFGLMFHAENEWIDITLTKTSTGDEFGSGFIKRMNNRLERDVMKFLNE